MEETYHTGTTLTKQQWIEVLLDKSITKARDIEIVQIMYSFEDHKAASSQVGLILGYEGNFAAGPVNLEIGQWGNRLVTKYPLNQSKRENGKERLWDLFFDGKSEKNNFIWKLKHELKQALEELNLTEEIQFSEEIPLDKQEILIEGAKKTIIVNSYERNSKAKELCKKHYGLKCQVCSFDFNETYGEIGKDYIHVHHLTKISEIGEKYEVNPIKDLRPVCPNCHAMLHAKEPPFTIDELKEMMDKRSTETGI